MRIKNETSKKPLKLEVAYDTKPHAMRALHPPRHGVFETSLCWNSRRTPISTYLYSELLKKMYSTGLFTQVAQGVRSSYLLMGTAKDGLSVTMEVMTTRLTEPEKGPKSRFSIKSVHPDAAKEKKDRTKVNVEMSFIF